MALTKAAIYLIGRIHPEIFDILGNPHGPYGGLQVGLPAQVAHTHAAAELNPQPLPPLAVGFQAGQDLFRLARTATQLRVAFGAAIVAGAVLTMRAAARFAPAHEAHLAPAVW